jgi:hypothetical protein
MIRKKKKIKLYFEEIKKILFKKKNIFNFNLSLKNTFNFKILFFKF